MLLPIATVLPRSIKNGYHSRDQHHKQMPWEKLGRNFLPVE